MSYAELWETDAGALALFLVEDGTPIWGEYTHDDPDGEGCVGRDYTGLVVEGCDPLFDQWDGLDDADLMPMYLDMSRWGTLIATDRRGETHALGFHLSLCGMSGLLAADAAGAATTCPGCGTLVSATHIPHCGAIKLPCCCPWCGAELH